MDLQKLETSKDELQESRARTKTIVGILLALIIIVLGVLFFIMWRQKEKMNETVARIDKIDPDHLGFRGASRNAHGDEVGSTGPTNYKTASTHN
jgi:hypothetical protein